MNYIFKNLKELIDRCHFCLICQNQREIIIDKNGEKSSFWYIKNDTLIYNDIISVDNNNYYSIKFDINIINNDCNYIIEGPLFKINSFDINKIKNISTDFEIRSSCNRCNSYVNSGYITIPFDKSSSEIELSLSDEGFFIFTEKFDYQIEYDYLQKSMSIFDHKNDIEVTIPVMPIDFSDHERAISQIKTLITFS